MYHDIATSIFTAVASGSWGWEEEETAAAWTPRMARTVADWQLPSALVTM